MDNSADKQIDNFFLRNYFNEPQEENKKKSVLEAFKKDPILTQYRDDYYKELIDFNLQCAMYLHAEQRRKYYEENRPHLEEKEFSEKIKKVMTLRLYESCKSTIKELRISGKKRLKITNNIKLLVKKIISLKKDRKTYQDMVEKTFRNILQDITKTKKVNFSLCFEIDKKNISHLDYGNYKVLLIYLSDVAMECLRYVPDQIHLKESNDYCGFVEEIFQCVDAYLFERTSKHCKIFFLKDKAKDILDRKIQSNEYLSLSDLIKNTLLSYIICHPSHPFFKKTIASVNKRSILLFKHKKTLVFFKMKYSKIYYKMRFLINQHYYMKMELINRSGVVKNFRILHIGKSYQFNFALTEYDIERSAETYEKQFTRLGKRLDYYKSLFSSYNKNGNTLPYIYYAKLFLNNLYQARDESFTTLNGYEEFFEISPEYGKTLFSNEVRGHIYGAFYEDNFRDTFENPMEFKLLYSNYSLGACSKVQAMYDLKIKITQRIEKMKHWAYEILVEPDYLDNMPTGHVTLNKLYEQLQRGLTCYLSYRSTVLQKEKLDSLLRWFSELGETPPFSLEGNQDLLNKCKGVVKAVIDTIQHR